MSVRASARRRPGIVCALVALVLAAVPASSLAQNACIVAAAGTAPGDVPQSGGIGGTGAPLPPDVHAGGGIGGTGAIASGGIGGTGKQADSGGIGGTGVVGLITGFASVCVGGLEIHVDAQTQVTRNGNASVPRELAIGQFVSIEAFPGTAGLHAVRIAVLDAAVGPVTQAGAQRLQVMGQAVRVARDTAGVAAAELKPGDRVRLSGLRMADGSVMATRIERADGTAASVMGPAATGITGSLRVGGVPVADGRGAQWKGHEVLASGRWDGRRLVAANVQPDPATRFGPGVRDVVLEGYADLRATHMRIAGREVSLPHPAPSAAGAERLVRITGSIGNDGRVTAHRIESRNDLLPRQERGPRRTFESPDRASGGVRQDGRDAGRKPGTRNDGDMKGADAIPSSRTPREATGEDVDTRRSSSDTRSAGDARSEAQERSRRDGDGAGGAQRERADRAWSGGDRDSSRTERRAGGTRERTRDR